MILIVATSVDPHADMVVAHLRTRGIAHQRVDIEAPQGHFHVEISGGGTPISWEVIDILSSRRLSSDSISSVWWRRSSSFLFPSAPQSSGDIDQRETGQLLRWLFESLSEQLFPFGHPIALRRAENKVLQWRAAAFVGFNVPPFVYTTRGKIALDFARQKHPVIVKSLSQAVAQLPDGEVSFRTSRIDTSSLARVGVVADSVVAAFLQQEVPRTRDVRAFVGKGWHFAVEISVATLPTGEVDWRPYVETCGHRQVRLPSEIIGQAEEFLSLLNVPCGHFDFIVDKDGNFHFLECNPNGQWAWLELQTGAAISEHVATVLSQPAGTTLPIHSA